MVPKPKPIVIKNRGYVRALREIYKIMINQQLIKDYEEYLEVTEGDKMAAAILTLAGIRQETEKAIEKAAEGIPQVGSFGTMDHGG
jgi:hypothetical protein